jgi:chaperonin cofactor prefoldin
VKVYTDQSIESVESFLWNAARDSAQVAMNKFPKVTYGTLYTNLQTALQQTYSTINECATVIANLKDATAKFLAGASVYTDVESVDAEDNRLVEVYNLYGQLIVPAKYTQKEAINHLKNGLYIIGNKKVIVQR